jgi:surface protein
VKKFCLIILIAACLSLVNLEEADAACPSADLSDDCKVNLDDFAIIASGWLVTYDANDLVGMASEWLDDGAFITTWDTSLEEGTTVTLALAGEIDAVIDWGDGTVAAVTSRDDPPGFYVHDYGVDGIYTVSVTGSATAYNSVYNYGGWYPVTERVKLISVDNWGRLGFNSMSYAFYECVNLVSVPSTSDGIEAVTDMSYMFSYASSFNSDIGGWDTSSVTDMEMMFYYASSFNSDISSWDTSNVRDMGRMFRCAESFNQPIGNWDTAHISNTGSIPVTQNRSTRI